MNTEKMKEVFSDEAFVKSLFELDTATEVQAALQEKGAELSEEALEQVSGGIGIIGLTVAWCVMGSAMLGLGTTVVVHEATSRHW